MSDFDSRASSPALVHRPSKRRRVYDDESNSSSPRSRPSSPDDLDERSTTLNNAHRRRNSSGEIGDGPNHKYHDHSRIHSTSPDTPRSSRDSPTPSLPTYKPLKVHYKQKFVLTGHKKGISQVRFSPDGRWIASGAADGTIKIWDATTGMHMRTLEGHLAGVSTIAWSPDSNAIASGSDDKTIRLWHRATGKPYPAPLLGHHNYVYSLAFSPKGNMLASGSYDEAVFLWDLRARRQMRSLPAHSDPVGGVDFIRDGTLVCSCSTDGLIRVWDAATGQCLQTIVHEDNAPVTTARFSPNGRYILAFTLDSCIRLWDYVSGTCKKTYQGHINVKYALGGAFGVTGSDAFIASGSETGEIYFWDVKSKDIVQKVSGHQGPVMWVDTCPGQSGTLVSGGLDATVRIWVDVNEDEHDHANGITTGHENNTALQGFVDDNGGMVQVKIENGGYGDDARERMSVDVNGQETPAQYAEESIGGIEPEEMLG